MQKKPPDKVMEDVSMNTTSAIEHSPYAMAVLSSLAPKSDSDLPLASVSPASPNEAGQQGLDVINEENGTSVTCSPEDESVRAEELSLKPAKAVPGQPEYGPDLPSMGKQELPIGAANVECSDEHPPYREAPVLPVPVDPDPSDGANAKWPSQEAISNIEMSVLLRSPESPAVLTPPTPSRARA